MRRLLVIPIMIMMSGCHFSASVSGGVDPVENLKQLIKEDSGTEPDSVTCADTLEAKVGAKTECTVKFAFGEYRTPVEVTKVSENNQVRLHFHKPLSAEQAAQTAKKILADKVGTEPESLKCEHPLLPKVGATIPCTLEHAGESHATTITATEINGDDVKLSVEVAP